MRYARRAVSAGAVLLGCVLGVRAQEPSTEPKREDAPPAKSASPSETPSQSARSRSRQPGQSGYRTGNDATDPTKQEENGDRKNEKQKADDNRKATERADQVTQRREAIDPKAPLIQFEFAKQPWDALLETLAEVAGLSLQMEFKPDGTFSYINDPNKYTIGEAIDVINDQLNAKGYTLIRKGSYLKLWPLSQPIDPAWIPRIKPDELDDRGASEFVSVIFPVESMSASAAVKEVEGFKGEYGKVVALDSSNKVMITDIVANIRLMRDMLQDIEGSGAPKSKSRTFQLKYIAVSKVESTLRDLFGLPQRSAMNQQGPRGSGSDRGGDPREFFRRMMEGGGGGGGFPGAFMQFGVGGPGADSGRGDRGGDPRTPDRGDRSGQPSQSTITLAVDETHNQLFVMAPPDKLAIAEGVIKEMDVPREGMDPFQPREPQTPKIVPYRLSDGDAQSLATALNTIYQNTPGVRISADVGNNMVIVTATPSDQEHIKSLVDQFEHDERNSVVLPLSVLDAAAVETLLTTVYASDQRDWRGNRVPRPGQPKIVADRARNQLMIRGSQKQVDDIRNMLAALGETTMTQFTGNEKLRVIPLNSANASAIQGLLEQYSKQVLPNKNRITIIDMNRRSDGESTAPGDSPNREPAGELRRPVERRGSAAPEESPPPPERPRSRPEPRDRTSRDTPTAVKLVSHAILSSEVDATDETNGQDETQEPAAQSDVPPVVVTFGPDNVVIASEDSEAVRMLANIIGTMARGTGGSGAKYTVFDLRTADVTQIQQTLSDLLGISTGSSFFDAGGAQQTSTLKLVADTRTNSLIVYGNSADVERVRVLLEVLDRDSPGSGALSAPRIIPVKYASASAVARVVRDVYASRVVTGQGSAGGFGGPTNSPFGGFGGFPGGSSSNRSARSATGTLAVGVDEQSNSIVVSCSEALFLEVRKLVETLDVAANNTERTVQIVTVKNSTPSAVQDALNGLMGISASSRGRSGSSESSNRGFSGFPSGGGPIGFQFGGFPGGGGSSPFGGNPFFGRGGFDSGRGGFDAGRGMFNFGGDGAQSGGFGRDRRP